MLGGGSLDSGRAGLTGRSPGDPASFDSGLLGALSGALSGVVNGTRGDVRSVRAGRSFCSGGRLASRRPSLRGSPPPSRGGRAGLVTAPVGRVSTDPPAPEVVIVGATTPSRPLSTRERRSSPSSSTPGTRAAAPVGRSIKLPGVLTLAGRATVTRSRCSDEGPRSPSAYAGLTGRSLRSGSALNTRRARVSSAGRDLAPPEPKSLAATEVTAR